MSQLDQNLSEAQETVEDSQKGKFLTFRIDREDYALEIRHVTEIIGIQKITEVPDMANYVRGVINLRGKVVPVIDVRARFHLQERAYDERTCIIVVHVRELAVGLVVDKVNEVADIPDEQIEPAPRTSTATGRYIQGIGKIGDEVKIILDAGKLLYESQPEMALPA